QLGSDCPPAGQALPGSTPQRCSAWGSRIGSPASPRLDRWLPWTGTPPASVIMRARWSRFQVLNMVLRWVRSLSGPPEPGSRYDGPGPPVEPAPVYVRGSPSPGEAKNRPKHPGCCSLRTQGAWSMVASCSRTSELPVESQPVAGSLWGAEVRRSARSTSQSCPARRADDRSNRFVEYWAAAVRRPARVLARLQLSLSSPCRQPPWMAACPVGGFWGGRQCGWPVSAGWVQPGPTVSHPYSSGATSAMVWLNCQRWPARSSMLHSRSPY